MSSVAVIGAGVVGASVAHQLARRGADVTLIDAGEPGGETSSRSFAWLNANDKPPAAYHRLNAEGIAAHSRLREALGRGPWLHETGMIRLVADTASANALEAHVAQLRGLDYAAEMIGPARARELEPRVRFDGAAAMAFFPAEGWAHGPTLVATLVEAAREHGARVLTKRRVEAIERGRLRIGETAPTAGPGPRAGESPADVARPGTTDASGGGAPRARAADAAADARRPGDGKTRAGDGPRARAGDAPVDTWRPGGASEDLRVDRVVIAAGRFSDRVAALAGLSLPLAPTCGLLAVTSPVADGPGRIVYAPGVHFRPDGDGRLVLQDDQTDATVSPDTPEDPSLPGCALLLERAKRYVPALSDARIEGARVGIRPMPADGFPVVGPAPGRDDVYFAVTHSGMTLGPLIGEIAAAELLGGTPDPRLETFRLARLLA